MPTQGTITDQGRYPMTGLPLHIVTKGNTALPSLVLLHGFSMSHAVFTPLMAQLSDRFHVIAPDLRGHGLSPKPEDAYANSATWADDIAWIVDPLDRPVLLGWSMGGRVVMDYIRHYGDAALAGVALIGSYTGPVPAATKANRGPMFDQAQRTTGTATFVRACTKAALPATLAQTLLDEALLCPHHVRVALADRDEDYTADAATIRKPTLVLRGDADGIVPPAASAAHNIPDATQIVYSGIGHTPFLEAPARFAQDISAFMRKARL